VSEGIYDIVEIPVCLRQLVKHMRMSGDTDKEANTCCYGLFYLKAEEPLLE
jgi:hypothetical protein